MSICLVNTLIRGVKNLGFFSGRVVFFERCWPSSLAKFLFKCLLTSKTNLAFDPLELLKFMRYLVDRWSLSADQWIYGQIQHNLHITLQTIFLPFASFAKDPIAKITRRSWFTHFLYTYIISMQLYFIGLFAFIHLCSFSSVCTTYVPFSPHTILNPITIWFVSMSKQQKINMLAMWSPCLGHH